jgi:hypothetical protein
MCVRVEGAQKMSSELKSAFLEMLMPAFVEELRQEGAKSVDLNEAAPRIFKAFGENPLTAPAVEILGLKEGDTRECIRKAAKYLGLEVKE